MNWAIQKIRACYDWTMKWAEHPKGIYALGLLALTESIFNPIPVDPFIVAMGAARPKKALHFAFVGTFFSVLGGVLGYFLGMWFWEATQDLFFSFVISTANFEYVMKAFQENAFLSIFAASFTPIPFKVFTVAGGVAQISFVAFLSAATIGRGLRFFILGGLLYFWGPSIRDFIDKYFEKLTIALFVVVLIAVVAAKLI